MPNKYTDWGTLGKRVEEIARARAIEEAREQLGLDPGVSDAAVHAALAEMLAGSFGGAGGLGLEMVESPVALDAFLVDAEDDTAVVEKFSGRGYRALGGDAVELFDRPREEVNSKAYGAVGDAGATTIAAGDITDNAATWGSLYAVGDTWDFVGLQESMFAAWARERIPSVTIAAGATTTVLPLSGTPLSGKDYAGGTIFLTTAGTYYGRWAQIASHTASSITLASALPAAPAAGDTLHLVQWHGSGTASQKRALYTPPGRYSTGSRTLYFARVVGGIWRGAGRFNTYIFSTAPRTKTLAINGMSYSWIEGIQFQSQSGNWYTTTWRPGLAVTTNDYVIPPQNGNLFKCITAGTTGTAVGGASGLTASGAGTARTIVRAGSGWSTGTFRDKWVLVTAGLGAGTYAKIVWNTSDTLYVLSNISLTDATSVFTIYTEPTWSEFGSAGTEGSDGTAAWQRLAGSDQTVVDLDYDNRTENWSGRQQSNTFANCMFTGEGRGTPHCLTLAWSGTSAMTSEHTFINCYVQWSTLGGIGSYGDNALQNTIVGGNMASNDRYALYSWAGGFYLYSVGMQNGIESQWRNNGADFYARVSNNDHSIASGVRSESLIFAKCENDHILSADACYTNVPISEWAATTAYLPGKLITGRNADANHDGRIFECVVSGTTGGTDPSWASAANAGDTITDGTVTWRLVDLATVSGSVHLRSCSFPWGTAAMGSNEHNYSLSDVTFGRHDWLRAALRLDSFTAGRKLLPTYGFRHIKLFRNYTASPGVGYPIRFNPLGVWPNGQVGSQDSPDARRNRDRSAWAIDEHGAGGAIYFSNAQASVGIRRGDFEGGRAREILAVEGKLGKVTPNNADSTTSSSMTYPANTRGEDFVLAGGYSTGSQPGGDVVLEAAPAGSAGSGVNLGQPRLRATVDGVVVTPGGGGTIPLLRDLVRRVTWDPPNVADGTFTTVDVTVFGAVVGDAASAGFSTVLSDGMWLSAKVQSADVVRVTLHNESGGAVDLASGTLTVEVRSRQAVAAGVGDITLLATTIGSLSAAYDCRGGITIATGVSQWDDARGAVGFGPSLTQATAGNQPAQLSDGTLLFDDQDWLESPADVLFDLATAKSIVVVGALGPSGQNASIGIDDGAGANRNFKIKANAFMSAGGSGRFYYVQSWNDQAVSDVEYDGYDIRCLVATRTPGGNLTLSVGDRAKVTDPIGSVIGAGNNKLFLPHKDGAPGFNPMRLRAVLVFGKALSDAEEAVVRQWAMSRHSYRAVGA